ncbi:DUF4881 domain-containing protein [uncultured Desulfovibrio sp.]|uniref:DUF4881 domain-containing protein n=1 Tax=uncultured Desulfovibrio sp. TaxID=167968 RepID=UPI00262D0112|nr:DUF4881 domain-containing protein [uncultured Desulfovibrio sp.]
MKIRTLLLTLGMLGSIALLAGCDLKGGVEQGRCVAFEKGKSATIVAETLDMGKGTYNEASKVLTYKLPVAARDMGPTPETGGLLAADPDKGFVLVYDKAAMKVAKLAVNFTDVEKNVDAKHPKVKDKTFPVIDKSQQTVTVYASGMKALLTFKIPAEAAGYDDSAWKFGNELRVAFLNASKDQALRIMNCTKTSIYKRK